MKRKYLKWKEEDRYTIGKYASENGATAPNLNESTVRGFRDRVEEELKKAKNNNIASKTSLSKYRYKTGRPLLLGDLDSMVQKYLLAASNRGTIITRAVAVSCGKALLKRYPNIVGNIDLDTSSWAQSLFRRMGFVRRRHTSSKVDIPEGARKEIEYIFLYDIVSKVEKYIIPDSLIINFDQTPSPLVPCRKNTMAQKGCQNVVIKGADDKRSITSTFAITLAGEFLPMQLIYGGKTLQSLPRYKFPDSFSLSVNETHYSNRKESVKLLEEIIIPYVEAERTSRQLDPNQKALVIMDVSSLAK